MVTSMTWVVLTGACLAMFGSGLARRLLCGEEGLTWLQRERRDLICASS